MKEFQLQLCDRPTRREKAETSIQQGEIERDYEPEQEYGTAHDFQEHTRFGGTIEDY